MKQKRGREKRKNEMGAVLKLNLWDYEGKHRLTYKQRQVVNDLMNCRTMKLGGHMLVCEACGQTEIAYNPCKDRHCPNCGAFEKAQWLEKQKEWMLPIGYYHIVFTLAHELNEVIWENQKVLYQEFFRIVARLLKRYGQKYLGGEVGFTMVMHTWGQTMQAHPHLHVIYTGGALVTERKGKRWEQAKETFLFPVVKLSADFRKAYCRKIRFLLKKGRLGGGRERSGREAVSEWVAEQVGKAEQKDWEVYIQKPEAGTEKLVEYLGKYVFRTAMSNHRIVSYRRGAVKFKYYDNRDGGKQKEMTLSGVEFIRRFLLHVLPPRFQRVRHYGLHHSSKRQELAEARGLLGIAEQRPEVEKLKLVEWLQEVLGLAEDPRLCPNCGEGLLESVRKFGPIEGKGWQMMFVPLLGKMYKWGLKMI